MRNANWAHGTPALQAQGVKPIAATSVINAIRRGLPNGELSPRSEVANVPPSQDSTALSVLYARIYCLNSIAAEGLGVN